MISARPRNRRKNFQCPITRGLGDFVAETGYQNPFRQDSPHWALYAIGYTVGRDSKAHKPIVPFMDLVEFSNRTIVQAGFDRPPIGTSKDRNPRQP